MYDSHLGADSWLPGMDSTGSTMTDIAQQAASEMQIPQDVTDEDAWKRQAVDAGGSAIKDLFGTVAESLGIKKDTPVPTTASAPMPSTSPQQLPTMDPGQVAAAQAAAARPAGLSPGMKTALMVGAVAGVAFIGYRMMTKPKRRSRRRRR